MKTLVAKPRGVCRPRLEKLESRTLLSGYQPSGPEQLFLELLNDARANPAAYGNSIGLDLSGVAASQPLAFNTLLVQTSRDHSQDMNDHAFFGHNSSSGLDPGQRLTAIGYPWTTYAESIAAGYATPADALKGLIIDAGISDLGHRKQLLAIGSPYTSLIETGVGIVLNGSGPYSNYYTIDSGATADTRPIITGVVFNDANHNGKYDVGEGLAGVTVSIAGVGSTVSFTSGGYSLRLGPGTYTVTASGPGLPVPMTQVVTVGPQNDRLNFNTATSVVPLTYPLLAAGSDAGGGPNVRVFNPLTGAIVREFLAYDSSFLGGVRVATGDVNNDGSPDIVTAPGPGGGPDIRVFDGRTGALIHEFMAYAPVFTGGVYVAVGDVNGDGYADIITGADAGGGPHVEVFSGKDGSLLRGFQAYDPRFTGGVRVAAGDVNGDGKADILTAPGPGGGPHVEVFSGADGSLIRSFYAYAPTFVGGVYVAAGDVTGDGKADIITGPGAGGGPQVNVFNGADSSLLHAFMAYLPSFGGGVRVAVADVNGDGKADILTGAGPGGGPLTQVFDGATLRNLDSFFAYDPLFPGGIFVGGH